MMPLPPADAVDAFLVSGGLPLILDEWPAGATVMDYLADALTDPTSALLVSAERALAIGGLPPASLSRALRLLAAKRLVDVTTPLPTRPSREIRYAVADPYLLFWLSFVGPYLPEIERGRGPHPGPGPAFLDLVAGRGHRAGRQRNSACRRPP